MANSLTVTEKEHWKSRIEKRIDKRIEKLTAKDPTFMERIQRDARKQSLVALGIAEAQTELDAVTSEIAQLEEKSRTLHRQILAAVRGIPLKDLDFDGSQYTAHLEIDEKIEKCQGFQEDILLQKHALGKQILALRTEKDNLLDTVWLATSPKQIRELWQDVGELLGDEPSDLQRKALATDVPTE